MNNQTHQSYGPETLEKLKDELKETTEKKDVEYKIRKLTPRECWRLMNFSDEDFDKAQKVNSNSQLYKQAGNSIVKSCLCAIFSQLHIPNVKAWNEMTLEEKYKLTEVK